MKCLRCGKEYTNAVPPVTNNGKFSENAIMADGWCDKCNQFCSNVLFRNSSAYAIPKNEMQDPMKRINTDK